MTVKRVMLTWIGKLSEVHVYQLLPLAYLLGGFEVSVDNLVKVQVVHATGNAHGPVNQQGGGDRAASP